MRLAFSKWWRMGVNKDISWAYVGRSSYRNISWSLEATRLGFRLQSLWHLTGISAAAIVERHYPYNIKSRGFKASRGLAVRLRTALWTVALGSFTCHGMPPNIKSRNPSIYTPQEGSLGTEPSQVTLGPGYQSGFWRAVWGRGSTAGWL